MVLTTELPISSARIRYWIPHFMKISISREKAYLVLVSLCLAFTTIRLFFGAISIYIIGNETVGKLLFYVVLLLCAFFAMPYYIKNVTIKSMILFLCWIFYCYLCARSAQLDSDLYKNEIKYMFVFGGLYFFIGKSFYSNKDIVKEQLYRLPTILNIIGILNFVLLGANGEKVSTSISGADYSMELSYANLISATICTVIFVAGELGDVTFLRNVSRIKEKRMLLVINLPISYLLVLIGGSRGPLLALFFVAIFGSIYSLVRHKNIIAIACLLLSGCFGLFFAFSGAASVFLNSEMRSLSMLADNNLLATSGREHYYSAAIKGIWENKFLGVGVFKDRVCIFKHFHRYYAWTSYGSYPHNIVLEVLLQFGIPLGALLFYFFGNRLRIAWKQFKLAHAQEVFLVIIGVGLFPLLVSKSYIQTWEFYLLVGVLLECKKQVVSAT